jgi:hypothetical protein
MRKNEPYFATGNLVLWEKELWIVVKWDYPNCELISCNNSNVTAHPSNKWPYKRVPMPQCGYKTCAACCKVTGEPVCENYCKKVYDSKRGINSIKFVADTLLDYVEKSMRGKFVGLEMGRKW